jgi:hypothetical protein
MNIGLINVSGWRGAGVRFLLPIKYKKIIYQTHPVGLGTPAHLQADWAGPYGKRS